MDNTLNEIKVCEGTYFEGKALKIVGDQRNSFYALVSGSNKEENAARLVMCWNVYNELYNALQMLYDENKEYITINNLGDVHHSIGMKKARGALYPGSPK